MHTNIIIYTHALAYIIYIPYIYKYIHTHTYICHVLVTRDGF
jgi:hypothetical protein